ncbi:MAG: tetratricopeptide repeat protein [Steroidobacteraceae bacterium]
MRASRRLATWLLPILAMPGLARADGAVECGQAADEAGRAALAEARGDWPVAARAWVCVAQGSDDPADAEQATRYAFAGGHHRAAEAAARRWLQLEPGREEARRFLALTLLRTHRDAEAAAVFGEVLASSFDSRAAGYESLQSILLEERNDSGAARVMEALAAGDPDLPEAWLARSVLWQRAEHGERALAAVRQALALRPDWQLAQLAEVRALMTAGQVEAALELSDRLDSGEDRLAQLNRAWMLVEAGRRPEARLAFEDLRLQHATAQAALEGLGILAFQARDFEAATRHFGELAKVSRGNLSARAYLGFIAAEQGEAMTAIRLLEGVETGSRALSSQLRAAELMISAGLNERAALQLADVLDADPELTRDLVLGRAGQLAEAGQGKEAVALVQRLRRLFPDDDDLQLAEAFLREQLGQVDAAIALMRDLLTRRPADATVLNSLGYTLVDRQRSLTEGYRLVTAAIEIKPDSYAIMDSVGWSLYRLGRLEEAEAWLARAWQRSRDPEVAAHLGELYWASGRRGDARSVWDEALAESPDHEALLKTRGRLER